MFPLSREFEFELDSVSTKLNMTVFSDTILVHFSQLNKIGTIIEAFGDEKNSQSLFPVAGQTFTVNILLGNRKNELLYVLGRQCMEILKKLDVIVREEMKSNVSKVFFQGRKLSTMHVIVSISLEKQNNVEDFQGLLPSLLRAFEEGMLTFK